MAALRVPLAVGFESRPGFALVEMASGQIVHRTRFPLSGPTTALNFLRDGRLAVVNRKTVNLYALPSESAASWPLLRMIEQSESTAQRFAASPDRRWLAMNAGNCDPVMPPRGRSPKTYASSRRSTCNGHAPDSPTSRMTVSTTVPSAA